MSETGRIDYSPDYKSEKKLPTIKEMSGSINFGGRVVFEGEEQIVLSGNELKARLERAVVKAAMKRHHAQSDHSAATYRGSGASEWATLHQADCDLREATLALEQFESLQEKK